MSYDVLRREVKQGVARRLYLFYGPEDYLKNHYFNELKKLVVDPIMADYSCTLFDGAKDPGAIYDACQSYPMFGGKRLVAVRDSGFFKPSANEPAGEGSVPANKKAPARSRRTQQKPDLIEKLIEDMPDFTCFVFIERDVDRRLTLYKKINENGLAVEFAFRLPDELEDWVVNIARRAGKRFTRDALRIFMESSGASMSEIKTELEKLLAYTAEEASITPADVTAVCYIPLKTRIFDLIDHIISGQKMKALREIDTLLGEREPAMRILSMLSNHLVLMRQMKNFAAGGIKLAEAAKLTGLHQYRAEKIWRQSAVISPGAIDRAIELCCAQDKDIKTGKLNDTASLYIIAASIVTP